MRVLFCWTDISGYMASCWRAFQRQPGVTSSHIIAWKVGVGEKSIAFNEQVMNGLSFELLDAKQRDDEEYFQKLVKKANADIIVLCGWATDTFRRLPFHPDFSNKKFVMTMDTPFTGSIRQRLGRLKVGTYLDRMDGVVCGGERSIQLARYLKIPEAKLMRGMYGFDSAPLEGLHAQRLALPGGWPKKFLYVGRYVSDKAIDVLVEGYRQYRKLVSDPWPLECHGRGVGEPLLRNVDGLIVNGFVQPADLPKALLNAGVYVIASRYEPWGVSIAEAAYAGLPVLCTKSCGAVVEMIRHLHNGYVFPTDVADELADGMLFLHKHYDDLPRLGENGIALAAPFDMNAWALRWYHFLSHTVLGKREFR